MADDTKPKITYKMPTAEQVRQPVDRYQQMTIAYNYKRDLREAQKPQLYGPGLDLYEEEKLRQEHGGL